MNILYELFKYLTADLPHSFYFFSFKSNCNLINGFYSFMKWPLVKDNKI